MTDLQTLQFYDHEAPTYRASGPSGVGRHLHEFLALLPQGARVLDLGCGGGRDSDEMIKLGFDVVPTDGSEQVAAKAEARLGRAVRVMRFDQLGETAAFDAVWAQASLLHVPRTGLRDVLSRVREALRPGGYHYASYKSGGHEGRDSKGRYFNYLNRAELSEAYMQVDGWRVMQEFDYTGGGFEHGSQGPWVAIILQRSKK